jgi:ferredoxin-NADP reductase
MNLEWQEGKVINIIDETASTKRYFIEVIGLSNFDYKPGQFVTLDLPIHEKKNRRWRSYSIASAPDGTNVFELVIVLVEDGLGTPYLWQNVGIGDTIVMRGPAGVFLMHEPIEHDYMLICTGTGIAPFRSMVHYLHNHQIPHKQIYLIFGTRTKADLLYFDELKQLEKQMDGFHYIPTLSREQWDGRTGYVHDVYLDLAKENPTANFMLCGWKNMIDEPRKNLAELGFDKKQIHFELYG